MEIQDISDEELISLKMISKRNCNKEKIPFSVGIIGETIAINFFKKTPGLSNLKDAPKGTKNVDALSRNGERYSIKTVNQQKKQGRYIQMSKTKISNYLSIY